MSNYAPLKLHWKMPFGKYKQQKTVQWVIDNDPSYFTWFKTTTAKFDGDVLLYEKSTPGERKNFHVTQIDRAVSKAVFMANWCVIKIKPEDRNFDLKPEDFLSDEEIGLQNPGSQLLDFEFGF